MRQLLSILRLTVISLAFIIAPNVYGSGNVSGSASGDEREYENAPTVIMPLPAQLSRGQLPGFSIRDRMGETRIQPRQLERMITPETKRVALIYFATWCIPCAHGASVIKNSQAALENNGILPIFINIGERDVAAINRWVDTHAGQNFIRLIDAQAQMTRLFGLVEQNAQMQTPRTLVLDRDLRPLFLMGEEGNDFPEILWRYNP